MSYKLIVFDHPHHNRMCYKFNILRKGSALAGVLLLSVMAHAQQLKFDSTTINVGTITEDDSAMTYHFRYENVSDKPITITKAETTCGCTQPKFKRTPILPKEKGVVSITFYPLGRVGEMHRSIYFHTDRGTDKYAFKLTLTGNVLPSADPYIDYAYAIGPLRLMQSTVNFRHVKGNRKQMIRIEVVNAGKKPLKLSTTGLPKYISFMSSPSCIDPNQKADLIFIVNPQECPRKGKIDGCFFLNGVGDINPLQRTMEIKGFLE